MAISWLKNLPPMAFRDKKFWKLRQCQWFVGSCSCSTFIVASICIYGTGGNKPFYWVHIPIISSSFILCWKYRQQNSRTLWTKLHQNVSFYNTECKDSNKYLSVCPSLKFFTRSCDARRRLQQMKLLEHIANKIVVWRRSFFHPEL